MGPLGSWKRVLGIVVVYAAAFWGFSLWQNWTRAVRLGTDRSVYSHYDIVQVRLWTRDPVLNARWQADPPDVQILKDGKIVPTIMRIDKLKMAFDSESGAWTASWPCPWNADVGVYTPVLSDNGDIASRLKVRPFRIERRMLPPLPQGFSVLTLETSEPWVSIRVKTPSGEIKDWRGMLDWAQYVGADAFWVLAGQTPGERKGETWVDYNFKMIPELAAECHKRGLKFGVYAQCYLTMSEEKLPRYQYAYEVEDGAPVLTRSISLLDPTRPEDIAELLERLGRIPGVDFLGLDYIRNALGGMELADPFLAEMPMVPRPEGWWRMTAEQKMVALKHLRGPQGTKDFIEAWRWWRAHRASLIIRRIKNEIGGGKPLWAFTLSWDRGWHHGQDPVMFADAGIDIDAVMLYEATGPQFDWLIGDWHSYLKKGDAQMLAGDVVDWRLHQRDPGGPKEFGRRLRKADREIYSDGPARGVFIHDLDRALHGNLGPWGTRGWMDEAKAVIHEVKSEGEKGKKTE